MKIRSNSDHFSALCWWRRIKRAL